MSPNSRGLPVLIALSLAALAAVLYWLGWLAALVFIAGWLLGQVA